ncbi:hypothetical protein A2U01_0119351, partial [Trifolium medium]|nr:hypothetical protein [Trifolium medium]
MSNSESSRDHFSILPAMSSRPRRDFMG